jgi:NAD-dependent DNA ligase
MAKKLKDAELTKLAKEIVLFDSYDDYEIDELTAVLKGADDLYHNEQESYLTDAQYDSLRRYVEMTAPDHSYFGSVGSEVRGGKVKLPYPMGSLTQIYEGEMTGWVKQHDLTNSDFVITDKLDGTSALVLFKKGGLQIAYSRGDGTEGADITRHIKKFGSLPKVLSDKSDLAIRGEVILTKRNFIILRDELVKRGKREYKNARNMVAGLMNSSENDPIVYDYLHFVAYEIVGDNSRSKGQMLKHLNDLGFMIPVNTIQRGSDLTDEYLTELLEGARQETDYEIDGIVIDVNQQAERAKLNPTRDTLNPAYALKYKVADASNLAIATVKSVEWNASKHGYLKPRVNIEPVELVGVTVQYATGFNAKFIHEGKIGPGAKIRITRSGDVIPFILGVVEPAKQADMPKVDWRWNDTNVDAVLTNPSENEEVSIQQTLDFFSSIDAPNLKEGSVREMFAQNKYKSATEALTKMIRAPKTAWEYVIGANGTKIYEGIRAKLSDIPLYVFLGSTHFFGRGVGVRKFKKLVTGLKIDKVSELKHLNVAQICTVEGFDEKTAKKIISGVDQFFAFYATVNEYVSFAALAAVPTTGLMIGQKVCFTGVRSKELEDKIVAEGGEIASTVSGKTTILVCLDPSSNSGKMGKAKALGIKCVTIKQMEAMLA